MDKCNKATERILRRIDVEMTTRCGEIRFILDGGEVDQRVEGVVTFRYLGRFQDQTDDYFMAVRQNIMCTRSVWGRLGTLL